MEYIFIYLLQISNIITVLSWTGLALFVFFGAGWFALYNEYEKDLEFQKDAKKVTITTLIITLFLFLIPTKQTMLLIGGTYLGKKAVKQVMTDKKIEKINTIIELELDKRIKELKQ